MRAFQPSDELEEFWALRDISFQVKEGESLGIIGRNGAGKSTLLKILSRITPPTSGQIHSRGRIASLLEVGTGFHQELTGRENIFMNGSILGMKRTEINAKFDEIVDFSGVEKFLDTPLKHYSSGMQLRLAFAVAAHLDPQILIIDEVLAVGDASFQRKCFQKIENVNQQGRTILFVSHNMTQVSTLCQTGMLLDQGKVAFSGDIHSAISAYLTTNKKNDFIDVSTLPRLGVNTGELAIKELKILNLIDHHEIVEGDSINLEIGFEVRQPIEELVLGISLTDFLGNNVVECRSTSSEKRMSLEKGYYTTLLNFQPHLSSSSYNLNLGARSSKGHIEFVPSVATIEISPSKNVYEEWNKPSAGLISVASTWKINRLQ
jgi:ABC-type polysaccharide/polyol phosphate transport system ATPase subunit